MHEKCVENDHESLKKSIKFYNHFTLSLLILKDDFCSLFSFHISVSCRHHSLIQRFVLYRCFECQHAQTILLFIIDKKFTIDTFLCFSFPFIHN
jgi:hypothetical protein